MDAPLPFGGETPKQGKEIKEELINNEEYKLQFIIINKIIYLKVINIIFPKIEYIPNERNLDEIKKLSNLLFNKENLNEPGTILKNSKFENEEEDNDLIVKLKVSLPEEKNEVFKFSFKIKFPNTDDLVKYLFQEIKIMKKNINIEKIKTESEIKELKNTISNYQNELSKINENKANNELINKSELLALIEENKNLYQEVNQLKTFTKFLNTIRGLKFESKIIDSLNNIEFLLEYILQNDKAFNFRKIQLLYRGSKDGDKTKTCHNLCDEKKHVLIFMKSSNGYIFGGYSKIGFKANNDPMNFEYKKDNNSFLFSINLKKIYPVVKDKAVISNTRDISGLCFHSSLVFQDNFMKRNENYIIKTITKCFNGFDTEFEMNGGEGQFRCKELEVFQLL